VTPPPIPSANGKTKAFSTPARDAAKDAESAEVNSQIPETPLKKRRGSGDLDVKSPARGLGFGLHNPPMMGFGEKVEFGGILGGGMDMEEIL
jgi:hypothetical protein